MELQKCLEGRRSIRRYRKMAVEQEKLEAVLETGRTSPTASNRQNLRFAVIRERLPEIRELAVEALYRNTDAIVAQIGAERYRYTLKRMHDELPRGGDRLFFGAPAVIVVIERGSGVVNGALAASRMELMAASLGLGVCYNGFFARAAALEPRIPELLGMGEGDRIAVTFAVGYPDVSFLRTAPRRDLRVEWL